MTIQLILNILINLFKFWNNFWTIMIIWTISYNFSIFDNLPWSIKINIFVNFFGMLKKIQLLTICRFLKKLTNLTFFDNVDKLFTVCFWQLWNLSISICLNKTSHVWLIEKMSKKCTAYKLKGQYIFNQFNVHWLLFGLFW